MNRTTLVSGYLSGGCVFLSLSLGNVAIAHTRGLEAGLVWML